MQEARRDQGATYRPGGATESAGRDREGSWGTDSCVNRDVAAGELREIAQPIFEFWPVQCTLSTDVPQAPERVRRVNVKL